MANVYDPLPYVSTAGFPCSKPGLDVRIIQRSYSYGFWAWTTCAADASYGGSDPHRWQAPGGSVEHGDGRVMGRKRGAAVCCLP
jgi:hypothetical protein